MGRDLPELHLIYGLVPLGVSFVAEQLRLAAADTVLAQRGLEGRADVEKLPEAEQRELVRAIVRREMGVMAASAVVVALLGVRAAGGHLSARMPLSNTVAQHLSSARTPGR